MRIFIILLFCLFSFYNPLAARSLHLFLLGDITDQRIGKYSAVNSVNIHQSFKYIAEINDIPLVVTPLSTSSDTLSRSKLIRSIRKAEIGPEDIIVLSYSGHGCREQNTPTIWPAGNFANERHLEHAVEFSEIMRRLLSKKAALYIVLLDCCNVMLPNNSQLIPKNVEEDVLKKFYDFKKLDGKINKKSVKKLFLEPYGLIIASAASPQEFGWGYRPLKSEEGMLDDLDSMPRIGQVFSKSFLNQLFYELQTEHPSWSNILKKTQTAAVAETKKECYQPPVKLLNDYKPPHTFQTPQYRVFLHKKRKPRSEYKRYLFEDCAYSPQQAKALTFNLVMNERDDDELDIYLDTPISHIVPKFLFTIDYSEDSATEPTELLP